MARMRSDIDQAVTTLDRYWELCQGVQGELLVARLYELARFLRSSVLLRETYRATRHESQSYSPTQALVNIELFVWERIKPCFLNMHHAALLESGPEQALNPLANELFAFCPLPGGSLMQFLKDAAYALDSSNLPVPHLDELIRSTERLLEVARCQGLLDCYLARSIASVLPVLHEERSRLEAARAFTRNIGTMAADVYLERLVEAGDLLLHGGDSFRGQSVLDALAPQQPQAIWASLTALVVGVRAHLLQATGVPLALKRLTTWFERFERRRLLAQVVALGSARTEMVIQSALDSFLFQEGFFPISHCDVGGQTDTVALPPWLEEGLHHAADAGQLPLVIELKQVQVFESAKHEPADAQPTAESQRPRAPLSPAGPSMRTQLKHARAQVGVYTTALRANPSWRTIKPWVVVVYGGAQRYSLADDDQIQLIYVGSSPPSKTKTLELRKGSG